MTDEPMRKYYQRSTLPIPVVGGETGDLKLLGMKCEYNGKCKNYYDK